MPLHAAPSLLLDLGGLLTLLLIGDAVAGGEPAAFKLAVAVHMWLRIYDGRFRGWRKATWLGFAGFAFLLVAGGFLAYVLPWGQMSFWLATKLDSVGWRVASSLATPSGLLWGTIGFISWATFIADMVALHAGRRHSRRLWLGVGLVLLVLVVVAVSRDILRLVGPLPTPSNGGLPMPSRIVPDASMLASFAVLRAVPSKPGGVALLALVVLLPLVAAWTRGWRFHAPPTRLAWLGLAAGLGLDWVALAGLGALPAGNAPSWAVVALVAYQFAFFLVVPVVLGRSAQPEADATHVFE